MNASELLQTAAMTMTAEGLPEPDWHDHRDIAVLFRISAAHGLAALLETHHDLGDGLMSGRYRLAVDRTGIELLERADTPTSTSYYEVYQPRTTGLIPAATGSGRPNKSNGITFIAEADGDRVGTAKSRWWHHLDSCGDRRQANKGRNTISVHLQRPGTLTDEDRPGESPPTFSIRPGDDAPRMRAQRTKGGKRAERGQ